MPVLFPGDYPEKPIQFTGEEIKRLYVSKSFRDAVFATLQECCGELAVEYLKQNILDHFATAWRQSTTRIVTEVGCQLRGIAFWVPFEVYRLILTLPLLLRYGWY